MLTLLKRPQYGSFFHFPQFDELELNIVNSNRVQNIDHGVVFRWGCTTRIRASEGTVNFSKSIRLASNKPVARQVWIKDDIRVPTTLFTFEQAIHWLAAYPKGTLIGRPQSHSMGRHFHIIDDPKGLQASRRLGDTYWTEFIRKDFELRIFCFFGRVIGVAKKTPREGMLPQISWNSKFASFRNVRWSEWNTKACRLALQATQSLGLHFGAVDLIREESSKEYYVLEINTSPGITSRYRIGNMFDCLSWLKTCVDQGVGLPEQFLLPPESAGYRDLIHPAIRSR